MKKGQVYEGIVERVDFPNKGIVRVGDETCIVKNSLPGQKVKLGVNKVRKGKAEARLLEVTEKSPLETGNPCSHFGVCGGCTYLSLPYEEQLKIKEAQVKKLLDSVLCSQEKAWEWEGIKGSPVEYEYRNKMEFTFGDEVKDGPLSLGMHKRGSFYDIVTVDDCKIVDSDYRLILDTVLSFFKERKVIFYHRLRHQGFLRHLLVRKATGTGEILLALVTTSQEPWGVGDEKEKGKEENTNVMGADSESAASCCTDELGSVILKCSDEMRCGDDSECMDKVENIDNAVKSGETKVVTDSLMNGLVERLLGLESDNRLHGKFAGILHITNDSLADVVKSDHTDILYGQDYFYEELLGLRFKISVFSFFQTNTRGAEVLYRTAREYVGEPGAEETVFDLYSGTGTIAQIIAPTVKKVIGVEIVEEAVEAARRNATLNGLQNCTFIAGDVLKVLDELEEKPDLIILDPPRDGIHPKALPKIAAHTRAKKMVYISCKPTSLARDLIELQKYGYQVERACCVDMFPGTIHVECVCLMTRKEK